MTKELEKALRHIKTRADAWAVREVEQALSQEPCEKCVYSTKDGYCQYDDISETIPPLEPCEDAISREAVIEWLENATYEDISDAVGTELSFLPSVTQKSGEWDRSCVCSVCGQWRILESEKNDGKYKYCPNCGAYMIEPQEREG